MDLLIPGHVAERVNQLLSRRRPARRVRKISPVCFQERYGDYYLLDLPTEEALSLREAFPGIAVMSDDEACTLKSYLLLQA